MSATMSDTQWDADQAKLDIAKDLREIRRMFSALRSEAVNRAGDPRIPGGAAMVMLGPRADVEAWSYVQMSALMGRLNLGVRGTPEHRRQIELDEIVKSDLEPPLSFLAGWADIVSEDRGGAPATRKASIDAEAGYLSNAIEWMTAVNDEGDPWWLPVEDFANQLHRVRTAMETALHDGVRADRINARCNVEQCDRPRLCIRWSKAGIGDHWYCPSCAHVFDADDVARCWRTMLVERGEAPEWVTVKVAAAALGRSVKSVRAWTKVPTHPISGKPTGERPKVASRRPDPAKPLEVNWPEARAADETTRRRGAYRALA